MANPAVAQRLRAVLSMYELHLIALKLLARDDERRSRDAEDLIALGAVATADDIALAEEAVRLISQRGRCA